LLIILLYFIYFNNREKVLKNGETVNIYIKNRNNKDSGWIPINMEVIDEEYRDGI